MPSGAMANKPSKEISIADMCPPICSQECLAFCPDMCCNGKSKSSAATARDIQPAAVSSGPTTLRVDVPSPAQQQSQQLQSHQNLVNEQPQQNLLNAQQQQTSAQEAPKIKAVVDAAERQAVQQQQSTYLASSKPVVNENQYLSRNAYLPSANNAGVVNTNLQQPLRQQIPQAVMSGGSFVSNRKPAPSIGGQEHLLMHRSSVKSSSSLVSGSSSGRYSLLQKRQQQQPNKTDCKRSCFAVCSSDCPMRCCDIASRRKRKRSRIPRKP